MGRNPKVNDDKRKPVTVRMIDREANPDIYALMDELIQEHHPEVALAKFRLAWHYGWAADVDEILVYAKIRKASALDKALAAEAIDYVIELNAEAWPGLDDGKQRQIMDHELCHATPDCDANGEQKMDEDEGLCWRVRKHPIQEFPEIIKRHGIKAVLDLNDEVRDAVDKATRPLLREAESDDADAAFSKKVEGVLVKAIQGTDRVIHCADGRTLRGNGASANAKWRSYNLAAAAFSAGEEALLEKAEVTTLGQLQDLVDQKTTIPGVNGNYRTRIEAKLAKYRKECAEK